MKIIKKFFKEFVDAEKRYQFDQWKAIHKLTEQEIIDLSVMLAVSGVKKPIINRLIKCQPAWNYIDTLEMGILLIRKKNELRIHIFDERSDALPTTYAGIRYTIFSLLIL